MKTEKDEGHIYFIKTVDLKNPMVKIGFTYDNVNKRLRELSGTSPVSLALLGYINGNPKKEKWLHRVFEEYRIHHEWFALSDRIKTYVNTMHDENGEHKLSEQIYEHINSDLYDGSTNLSENELKKLIEKMRMMFESREKTTEGN